MLITGYMYFIFTRFFRIDPISPIWGGMTSSRNSGSFPTI